MWLSSAPERISSFDLLVEAAGLDQVGNDDRVRGRAGGAQGPIVRTRSGSIESSQSLVPVAIRDSSGETMASS